MTSPTSDYRARIYGSYVSGREHALAPTTLEGLNSRKALISNIIRDHFPTSREAHILDLGCGHGAFVYFANLSGYQNVVGVDVSREQVEAAQKLGIKGVVEGDLMETLRSLPDESQDLVIAWDIIEHFTKSELLPFVDQVRRVLKPGGKWLIHAPNGESPFYARVYHGDYTHEQAFTRTSINQLLLASGFAEVRCYEDVPIPHGIKSSMRNIIWRAMRAGLRLYLSAETGMKGRECILSQNFVTVARR